MQRGAISTELASGRLDLAIDVPGLRGPDLERLTLLVTPYACVMVPDHPQARSDLTMERFIGLRHVVVSSRREGRSYVEEIARAAGHRITPVMRLPHYMPALEIVRHTHLALTVPLPLAQDSGLAVLALPDAFSALDSVLYWRRENAEDPALAWLRDIIREVAEAL